MALKVDQENFSAHKAADWFANEEYYVKRLQMLVEKENSQALTPAEQQELLGLRSKQITALK